MIELFLRDVVGLPAAAVVQMSGSPGWAQMLELAPSTRYDALILGRHELPQQRLTRIGIRTLVLAGSASFPWIVATARAISDLVPRAEFAMLPGQTHSPAPDVLCPELISFFGA